jgi:phage terminase large subunit
MSVTLRIETPRAFVPLLKPGLRYYGAHGGRGSGKSHFFGERVVEEAAFEPGCRVVCIREIQKSLKRSSKQLISDKIKHLSLGRHFQIQEAEIKTKSGGVIIFNGMQDHNAESIKSLEGFDIYWAEEANALSSRSLSLLRPTIRTTPGRRPPQFWASWNPEEKTDPIDVLFRGEDPRNLPSGGACVQVNYEDNPYFPDDLRAEMEYDKRRDYEKYLHTWRGGYLTNSEKRVFKNYKVVEFDTPPNANFRMGADFGFAQDPSVLCRMFIGRWEGTGLYYADGTEIMRAIADDTGRVLFIDREAWRVGCDVDHTPALFAGDCPYDKGDPRWWPNPHGDRGVEGALSWPIIADSARPETISYLVRRGFRVTGARKGPGSVEEGVNFLKGYDIVVHATQCPHVADEMRTYSYKVDATVEPPRVLPKLEDKKNHTIDSARYAVENVSRKRGWFG